MNLNILYSLVVNGSGHHVGIFLWPNPRCDVYNHHWRTNRTNVFPKPIGNTNLPRCWVKRPIAEQLHSGRAGHNEVQEDGLERGGDRKSLFS